ncbi:S-adenosyl-L-methionine-dependent methyltransferase [Coniophora puteana RWD-64-598 SS2]|uniref:S-adenosyl-L-methionine-dependent methyltransferase n=1 Tax=Coniophora puteana (strain RWD-64-598) TaxID=741705 RepID=A0A5M3MNP8_CONPW|nr:S-adenosyl-L-methionine-dependent methyltransferase [Coniophora puteana RWD-64-598 SS2]EIW80789.1 S-adenosyl-L-methionine-dependent methyltransferase [Coniophora puteana RWD-64-598 SS2]
MSGNVDVDTLLALINSSATAAVAEWQKKGQDVPPLSAPETHPIDTATDVVALKKALRVLEGACEHLTTLLSPNGQTIYQRSYNMDTHMLRVTVERKVPDILAKYPEGLHVTELSEMIDIPEVKLGQIMRANAMRHIFLEVDTNVFANSRLSHSMRSDLPNGFGAIASRGLCETQRAGALLSESLADPEYGPSFEASQSAFMYYARKQQGFQGKAVFEWLQANPERRENFAIAMVGMGYSLGGLTVLHAFPWQNYTSVCDIGAGVGTVALHLARKFPNLKITLQDREEVVGHAIDHWAKAYPEAVSEKRVDFVPIDFLVGTPIEGCELYYLRFILHDWPDSDAQLILNNVRKTMGPNSRLLLHDYVVQHLDRKSGLGESSTYGVEPAPEPLLPTFGAGRARAHYMDISMQLQFNAKERSLGEVLALASSAGFKFEKYWDLAETSMVEFSPA